MSTGRNNGRIARRFQVLAEAKRGGLVTYLSAGDPDLDTSLALFKGLPAAGADLIEMGMPFSDPMADGPAIQVSSQRALKAGITVAKTLDMVRAFRRDDGDTPLILMGYFNPIYNYGCKAFAKDAAEAGVDGLIVVDLPPEEDEELRLPATDAGLSLVRLVAPTTDEKRLPAVLANSGGFIYYVSITGITGTRAPMVEAVNEAIKRLRPQTDLPIAVGFGIRTPDQAGSVAAIADAAVVGSALVERVRENLDVEGRAEPTLVAEVLGLVGELTVRVRGTGSNA